MESTRHTIREDDQYTVIVGWRRELQTFYAYVFEGLQLDGDPLLAVGQNRHEIPTISQLESIVSRFARLEPSLISTLRDDAPLFDDGQWPVFELRCSTCGYGITVRIAPDHCPMCSGAVWEHPEPPDLQAA